MEDIHYTFRILTLSQAILLCLYHLLYRRNPLGRLIALNSFAFACYLVMPFARDSMTPQLLIGAGIVVSSSIPAFIWLLAHRFFNDDDLIPAGFWLAWGIYMMLWIPGWKHMDFFQNPAINDIVFRLLPQVIKLGFVVHVIHMALEGRANDLVASRLKMRVPLAIGAGLVAAIVILVEIWAAGYTPLIVEATGSVLLFMIALAATLYVFRPDNDLAWTPAKKGVSRTSRASEDFQADIRTIQSAMVEDRFYASHGATIGDLADLLSTPAYRLRAIINQRMDYRNFNQFLNHYRIEEATTRLKTEPKLPILSIALDVGFKSLSSFNKAFRDIHGKTPSEYRAEPKRD